ncbi:3-isopropylmalate dehydrogenase [Cercospora zeina]
MSEPSPHVRHTIVVCSGDYCGPEVVAEGIKVLHEIERHYPHIHLDIKYHLIGGAAWDRFGVNITEEALADAASATATLVGAVGGPKWKNVQPGVEWGLGRLRKKLEAFGNLRPIQLAAPSLSDRSALKSEVCNGTNILIIRELTGGIYFGDRQEYTSSNNMGYDVDSYTREEIVRVARLAGSLAIQHEPPLQITSVDKANVLAACGRMWRHVVTETIHSEFPTVELRHLLVDTAAMELVSRPTKLNGILLTSNMFGDILSDEASAIVGSIGLLPSASLSTAPTHSGDGIRGLYEPIHGSAPDLHNTGMVNPVGTILTVAMMCRYSLGLEAGAMAIEMAVRETLEAGILTPDLGGSSSTSDVGDAVVAALERCASQVV